MTLLLMAGTWDKVVQASDRRLSVVRNGRTERRDDEHNKAVCVLCEDAKFSISYTGLGKIGLVRTDRWIACSLQDINAGFLGVDAITTALTEQLTSTFRKIPRTIPKEVR